MPKWMPAAGAAKRQRRMKRRGSERIQGSGHKMDDAGSFRGDLEGLCSPCSGIGLIDGSPIPAEVRRRLTKPFEQTKRFWQRKQKR